MCVFIPSLQCAVRRLCVTGVIMGCPAQSQGTCVVFGRSVAVELLRSLILSHSLGLLPPLKSLNGL